MMNIYTKITRGIACVLTIATLAGCTIQPKSIIESNQLQGYKPTGKSIHVLSKISETQPEFDGYFRSAISEKFRSAGYKINYTSSSGLELNEQDVEEKLRKSKSKQILVITPNGGTKGYQTITEAIYKVTLIDAEINKPVYRAIYKFTPYWDTAVRGIVWKTESAEGLANHIYDDLKSKNAID